MRRALIALLLQAAPAAAFAQVPAEPVATALAYGVFQDDVTVIRDAQIDSTRAMDLVLARAARHERDSLARGFIAYGALAATRAPEFRAGVQSRVRAAGRGAVIRQLRRDLGYARRRPPGGEQAVRMVLAMAQADAARMRAVAERYETLGLNLQMAGWAHSTPDSRAAREIYLRALAHRTPPAPVHVIDALGAPLQASPSPLENPRGLGGVHFWDSLSDAPYAALPAPDDARIQAGREITLDRMLTLAGLVIVAAVEEAAPRVEEILPDPALSACLDRAQLHFRQCASVAYGADEDAFCLARHGLREMAACFAAIAAP